MHGGAPGAAEFVRQLAEEYFPGADAEGVATAIEALSTAMGYYPFDMSMLYTGPANYALAYPLTLDPLTGQSMGASWMMIRAGMTCRKAWGSFPSRKLYQPLPLPRSRTGRTASSCSPRPWPTARMRMPHGNSAWRAPSEYCYHSTWNAYRTYKLRLERPDDAETQFQQILADEIAEYLEQATLPLLEVDPRLGFHAECQGYMYSAEAIREKLAILHGNRAEVVIRQD